MTREHIENALEALEAHPGVPWIVVPEDGRVWLVLAVGTVLRLDRSAALDLSSDLCAAATSLGTGHEVVS